MTLDLRDRIADAIARAHVATAATVHPLMEDYRPHADAVMEALDADQDRRRAYTEKRVEWARQTEAKEWQRRLTEELEDRDAHAADMQERIAELWKRLDRANHTARTALAELARHRELVERARRRMETTTTEET